MTTCTSSTSCASDPETALKPRYSVNGDKDNYQVRVELPGARKDSIHVNLDQGVLTIQAQRKPAASDGWRTLHRELSDLGYALRLKLNAPVNDAALTAKLEDGVLTLSLPVKEAAKPRVIAVQ